MDAVAPELTRTWPGLPVFVNSHYQQLSPILYHPVHALKHDLRAWSRMVMGLTLEVTSYGEAKMS